MSDEKKKDIGALWQKTTSKGKRMLSGTINGQRIVCWENANKSNPRAPDWRIFVDDWKPDQQRQAAPPPRDDAPPVDDDDAPF